MTYDLGDGVRRKATDRGFYFYPDGQIGMQRLALGKNWFDNRLCAIDFNSPEVIELDLEYLRNETPKYTYEVRNETHKYTDETPKYTDQKLNDELEAENEKLLRENKKLKEELSKNNCCTVQ